jgi:hypothetical protein
MSRLNRVVLDVLKPHAPDIVDFARMLAERAAPCQVHVRVAGVDAKTETIIVEVCGDDIDQAAVAAVIKELGGSVHSVDEVSIDSRPPQRGHRGS